MCNSSNVIDYRRIRVIEELIDVKRYDKLYHLICQELRDNKKCIWICGIVINVHPILHYSL